MHNKDLENILINIAIKELLSNNWHNVDINFLSKQSKKPLEEILSVCSSKKDLLD